MKVHVKSFGCSANMAEGEIIKGKFSEGSSLTETEQDADTIVLNICTVKGDKGALDEVKRGRKENPGKKIVIAGCITPSITAPIKAIDPTIQLVNTHHINEIAELKTDALAHAKPIKLMQPRVRTNPAVGIVPISSGCLDACAFCSTRLVKGTLFSFPPDIIVDEVKKCVDDGCKEIWITGQDTCCYGFDRKTNLAKLLAQLVEIPGDFKIRVGMGNPRHLPKFIDEMAEVMKNPKIFKFLHIPMQSGNDDVLKAMRRGHTVEQFKQLVNKFKQTIPEITISTDIIVGYPGETTEQFNDTVNLVKELEIDNINISRFAPRPGTPAATMKNQVHGNISKERSTILAQEYKKQSIEKHKKWLGWEGGIKNDEKTKERIKKLPENSPSPAASRGVLREFSPAGPAISVFHFGNVQQQQSAGYRTQNEMSGRNYAYKTVIVRENLPLGSVVRVRIIETQAWCLIGERI